MKKLFLFIVLFCLASCNNSTERMVFDEIVYIKKFPYSSSLINGKQVNLDIIGPTGISIQDSLLIVSTMNMAGMWSFFSLPEYQNLGKYLNRGRGPNEFLNTPQVEQQYFYNENGELFSILYDFSVGKTYRMNVNETIHTSKLSISETDISLPPHLFGYTFINRKDILCREINGTQTEQIRYLLSDGEIEKPDVLGKLNRTTVHPGEDINILSVHTASHPNGGRIVEAAIGLNQINLYSLDGSFGKTICVGRKVDDIEQIQSIDLFDRKYTYMILNAYPHFFGALYLNDTEVNYQEGKTKNPTIQFFNWDGEPLLEVKSDRMFMTYDIDFINGVLYTLNHATEEIYSYDISDLLSILPK
jgi:hypothetical protein